MLPGRVITQVLNNSDNWVQHPCLVLLRLSLKSKYSNSQVTYVYVNIISEYRLVSHLASNSIQVSGSLGGKSATTEGNGGQQKCQRGNITEYINLHKLVKNQYTKCLSLQ